MDDVIQWDKFHHTFPVYVLAVRTTLKKHGDGKTANIEAGKTAFIGKE